MTLRALCAATAAALWLASCAQAPPAPVGLMDVAARPAEKALLAGIRAYEDAQYDVAESQLKLALQTGLASPKDRAVAHKHLPFIDCTSQRIAACETEFRLAREADPAFELSRSEAGHPVWGPVYRKMRP